MDALLPRAAVVEFALETAAVVWVSQIAVFAPDMMSRSNLFKNRRALVFFVGALLVRGVAASDWQVFPLRENGAIPVWTGAGPFPNSAPLTHGPGCFGYFRDYLEACGGEAACVPAEGDEVPSGDGTAVVWRTAFTDMAGLLDFIDTFHVGKDAPGVAYAFCRLVSAQAQDALLKVRSNDGVRVWLNGQMIHEHHVGRSVDEGGEDIVPVTLGSIHWRGRARGLLTYISGMRSCRWIGPRA